MTYLPSLDSKVSLKTDFALRDTDEQSVFLKSKIGVKTNFADAEVSQN
jgi:hypothetical protein